MTTAYPGGIDDFAEASPTYMSDPDSTGRTHDSRHDDVESAVEAIEKELGVNPSGNNATVAERLTGIRSQAGETIIGQALKIDPVTGYAPLFIGRPSGGYVIIDYPGDGANYYDSDIHSFRTAASTPVMQVRTDNGVTIMGRSVPTHYWDETVGRRLFVWDTNNARWQMVYGDTGWRDIAGIITVPTGYTVATAHIRRVNNVVSIRCRITTGSGYATGMQNLWDIPAGYQVAGYASQSVALVHLGIGTYMGAMYANDANKWAIFPTAQGGPMDCHLTWTTVNNWPATLPGVAIGAIPTLLPAPPVDGDGNTIPMPPQDIDPGIPTGLTPDDDISDWTVTYPEGPRP